MLRKATIVLIVCVVFLVGAEGRMFCGETATTPPEGESAIAIYRKQLLEDAKKNNAMPETPSNGESAIASYRRRLLEDAQKSNGVSDQGEAKRYDDSQQAVRDFMGLDNSRVPGAKEFLDTPPRTDEQMKSDADESRDAVMEMMGRGLGPKRQ